MIEKHQKGRNSPEQAVIWGDFSKKSDQIWGVSQNQRVESQRSLQTARPEAEPHWVSPIFFGLHSPAILSVLTWNFWEQINKQVLQMLLDGLLYHLFRYLMQYQNWSQFFLWPIFMMHFRNVTCLQSCICYENVFKSQMSLFLWSLPSNLTYNSSYLCLAAYNEEVYAIQRQWDRTWRMSAFCSNCERGLLRRRGGLQLPCIPSMPTTLWFLTL